MNRRGAATTMVIPMMGTSAANSASAMRAAFAAIRGCRDAVPRFNSALLGERELRRSFLLM